MRRMWLAVHTKWREFLEDEEGQNTTMEYAVFAVLIAFVCIIALTLMFNSVKNIYAKAPQGVSTST